MKSFKVKKIIKPPVVAYSLLLVFCLTGFVWYFSKLISPEYIVFPRSFNEVKLTNSSFVFKSLQKAGFVIEDVKNGGIYSCAIVSSTTKPCSLDMKTDLSQVSIYWFDRDSFFNMKLVYAIKKNDFWLLTPEQMESYYAEESQNRLPTTMGSLLFLFLSIYVFFILFTTIQKELKNEHS